MAARWLFFFNDTATTVIYTLSLHDALPIYVGYSNFSQPQSHLSFCVLLQYLVERKKRDEIEADRKSGSAGMPRPISYAVFCLKKKRRVQSTRHTSTFNALTSSPIPTRPPAP